MKRIYSELLCAALIGACVSCTPEEEFTRSNGQMGLLGFSVGVADDNGTSSTRSESYVVDTFVLGDDTLNLVCTVTDLDAPAPEAEETSATRGTPIYTRKDYHNLETVYGKFNVSAFKVDGSGNLSDFMPNYVDPVTQKTVDPTGLQPFVNIPYSYGSAYEDEVNRRWEYWTAGNAAKDYFWWEDANHADNNYKLAFYAYAPTGTVLTGKAKWADDALGKSNFKKDGIIEFTYTVPVGSGSDVDKDAEVQPDILVGYTAPQLREDLDTKTISGTEYYFVDLIFYHALCGVNFKATENLATNENGLTINSITLSGLKDTGKCTFNPAGNASTHNKSYDKISWDFTSYTDNDGEYTQTFNYPVPNITGANAFNDAKDQKDATLYGAEEGTGASKNFMLIPQSYGKPGSNSPDATLTIDFTYKGVTKTKTVSLLPSSATSAYTWQAGKLYTYQIDKVVNAIEVAVVEDFVAADRTKKNVNAKNIGTANAYVRAAVIANWVDGNGSVIAPLDFTSVGTDKQLKEFCGFNTGTDKWVKGSDGFYYYPKIVKPGNEPKIKLFGESLVAGKSPAEDTGAHLVVTVIVQGLEAGSSSSDYATKKATAESTWGIGTSILTTDMDV